MYNLILKFYFLMWVPHDVVSTHFTAWTFNCSLPFWKCYLLHKIYYLGIVIFIWSAHTLWVHCLCRLMMILLYLDTILKVFPSTFPKICGIVLLVWSAHTLWVYHYFLGIALFIWSAHTFWVHCLFRVVMSFCFYYHLQHFTF